MCNFLTWCLFLCLLISFYQFQVHKSKHTCHPGSYGSFAYPDFLFEQDLEIKLLRWTKTTSFASWYKPIWCITPWCIFICCFPGTAMCGFAQLFVCCCKAGLFGSGCSHRVKQAKLSSSWHSLGLHAKSWLTWEHSVLLIEAFSCEYVRSKLLICLVECGTACWCLQGNKNTFFSL